MSLNSKISNTKATWKEARLFGQEPPQWVLDGLTTFNNVLNKIEGVIEFVTGLLNTIKKILSIADDLITNFIQEAIDGVLRIFMDGFTAGGSFIIIHPWNSKQAQTIDLFEKDAKGGFKVLNTKVLPNPVVGQKETAVSKMEELSTVTDKKNSISLPMKSLTPQQAFNDFYQSFSDLNDKKRPQWTDDDYAAGFGFIITTADISGFISLVNTMQQFFNFSELTELSNQFNSSIKTGKANILASGKDVGTSAEGIDWSSFVSDLSGLSTFVSAFNPETNSGATHPIARNFADLAMNDLVGVRHWETLSLSNIPMLEKLTKEITKFIDTLLDAVLGCSKVIQEYIDAIVKKLNAIIALIEAIQSAVNAFVTSLSYTGLYTFTIPKGLGGVTYVKQALQTSLNESPLAPVLNTSTWSVLFFAGLGGPTSETVSKWGDLFQNVFSGLSTEILDALALATKTQFHYKLAPNFEKTLFHYGQEITLNITSMQATALHPYYYTYVITDSENTIVSQQTQTRMLDPTIAMINKSKYTFILRPPANVNPPIGTKKYKLSLKIFDYAGVIIKYSTEFAVSDTMQINPIITNISNGSITTNQNTTATINMNGTIVDTKLISAGTTSELGNNLPAGANSSNYTVVVRELDGATTILPISNYSGYPIYTFTSIQHLRSTKFIRVESLPILILMDFEDIMLWNLVNNDPISVDIPEYIFVEKEGMYEYTVQDINGIQYTGELSITLVSNSQNIC